MTTLLKNLGAVLAIAVVSSFATACSCGDDEVVGDGDGDGDGDADAIVDEFPVLGTQIDRSGRAAISTALIAPFEPDGPTRTAAKEAYNSNADSSSWQGAFTDEIHANIAILDGIVDSAADGVCGDQFGFGNLLGADDYDGLAGALALDFLLVDISNACAADPTSQSYLKVEADLNGADLGVACGGRDPNDDVVDLSYTVLTNDLTVAVSDGVDGDDATHSEDTFPFLAAPQ